MRAIFIVCLIISNVLLSCSNKNDKDSDINTAAPLFTLLSPDSTQVFFTNQLNEGPTTNVLTYEYFYNGAGVSIGDLNGDDLEDLYFTGNMSDNKLYLNKGNMLFQDITKESGAVNRSEGWRTGVTIADVNGDGKRDIFVSYSGKTGGENRVSQLFINQGNDASGIPHFKDEAQQYGLADSAYSTQAYFFDYDRDGDLDMFALNHNPNNLPLLDEPSTAALLQQSDKNIGVRLYNNTNNHFTDITPQTGLSSSVLTYGLGAGIADINMDGWPDIYIANDYSVPDFLYINNKNGTFTDKLQSSLGHTSKSSMGNNVADINNDGLPDIFVLDMLPEENSRQKLLFASDNYEKFQVSLRSGFYYQYMRNMLQLNNGNGTFSEIGQLAGISNTDWSWAPLFADYDNDGWKDLYVTNGYTRDFTNMDFLKYMNDFIQVKGKLSREDVVKMLQNMPASNLINHLYKNNGDLTFADMGRQWGIDTPSNSNGAAYADLDNDGDLDLVVNNVNLPAFIYRNENNKQSQNGFLNIKLKGEKSNTDGIGAKVFLYHAGQPQYQEQMPARGFQSTVSTLLHFGLGNRATADSLVVIWQNGTSQTLKNLQANQLITLNQSEATIKSQILSPSSNVYNEVPSPLHYTHAVININDFKRQPLLVNPLSISGPCLAKGDVNGDGLDDIYAGGGSGVPGVLYLQQKNGQFIEKRQADFEADKLSEDADAVFFDANGDGKMDLYVASGGYHNYAANDALLNDRFYTGDGKGTFTRHVDALPQMPVSKSCVKQADVNGDGFYDLFVGGRVIPGRYPETPESFLLINDGKGKFTNQIQTIAADLQHAGMVTDAAWADLNGDNIMDLVVVGEWMPVSVYINKRGKLDDQTLTYFAKRYTGWWNRISVGDFNKDGKPDLVVGNMGLNSQCKASEDEPATMVFKDFDDNGSIDPILCLFIQGKQYPYVTRDELLDAMSMMRSRFTDYKSYADATLETVFTAEELEGAKRLNATHLTTTYFESASDGKFSMRPLPIQAQYAPVYTITSLDYDSDGDEDLLLCGNINQARLRFGKYDANYGVLLNNDGRGKFNYVPQQQSGFKLTGDVRSVVNINNTLLFGLNQKKMKAYKLK